MFYVGENHVFRFNNPEEVRKQRDRANAKTSMHLSITAADLQVMDGQGTPVTRPDSPSSSADLEDVDWNFAKREAAFARLGLDPALDNLPDEDLNKLYEKITKVKTLRDINAKRPESSLSQADDVWSESGKPMASDAMTDDTSVDAGASNGSPDMDNTIHTAQEQLELRKADFESRLQAMSDGGSSEAEDLKAEKEQMEHQLKLVQVQMKRILEAKARGASTAELAAIEPVIYTAKQLRLIRKVLDRWRAHRSFSMAESVLTNAIAVKEANIISKELGKDVSYNFTIASGGSLAAPRSALANIAGLDEFGDVADPVLASATQPSVGVKVLDKRHNAIYVWSFDRLQQQLQRMRNLTTFIDRPSYSRHFSSEEPFYDSPPPDFSFIGNAMVSLSPLSRRISSTCIAPIFCRYTAEAIGSCRIELKVVNTILPNRLNGGSGPSTRSSSPIPNAIPSGSKLTFILTVDSVKGLSSHDFSSAHTQVRLSAFVGPTVSAEEMFPSNAIDLDTSSLSDMKLRKQFSIAVTSKVSQYLRRGYAPIEFFARVTPTYLERLERWDEMREHKDSSARSSQEHVERKPPAPQPNMRRSETEFLVEEIHDVATWLQVRELAPDGQYAPVPVISQGGIDPGCFSLRQGLQRRITLTLTSNSGRQLPWTEITRVRLGHVRLLDPKGRLHESTSKEVFDLSLLKQQDLGFKPDGTGYLSATALWDSSVHDCALLNRVTVANHRILLQLNWFVSVENCADPIQFNMDVAVSMHMRDASPPSRFMTFFGSSKVMSKTSTVFSVKFSPPLTRSPKDLWRLDTSEKYVRGEESLGTWKPRGISVVEDHDRLVTTERRAADVQAIRTILSISPPSTTQSGSAIWGGEELLRKSLALWQKQFGHAGKVRTLIFVKHICRLTDIYSDHLKPRTIRT